MQSWGPGGSAKNADPKDTLGFSDCSIVLEEAQALIIMRSISFLHAVTET